MGAAGDELARLVGRELFGPVPAAAERFAAELRHRLGPGLAAVAFYGSCLRRDTAEGVLDFYVLVDDYRGATGSRLAAWAGAALPPTVVFLEIGAGDQTLRAKYALLTAEDFARGARTGGLRTGIWARFCQPVRSAYVRDDAARAALVEGCVESILSAVTEIAPLLPDGTSAEGFWQAAFRETYAREMRSESAESVRALYAQEPERYRRALAAALAALSERGTLRGRLAPAGLELDLGREERAARQRRWRRLQPLVKLVYVAQLMKTAFTFGDWLPYVLWKLERHSGQHIPYSERQRRHPFLFGWPLLWRILRTRALR